YQDDTLDICKDLEKKYTKVKLYQHPNSENRGAGSSKNLGIERSMYPYIAFLDADDYCLPDRFEETEKTFRENDKITAVYEPVGTAFFNDKAKEEFCKWRNISIEEADSFITYMLNEEEGKNFLISLLKGRSGSPHINGITLKKHSLNLKYLFNTKLTLHQDAEFWTRISYYGYFSPVSKAKPIAIRFAHLDNRITKRNFYSIHQKEKILLRWAKQEIKNDPLIYRLILKRYIYSLIQWRLNSASILALSICKIFFTFAIIIHPKSWK